MRKQTNTSLDDLFRKASADADPHLVSNDAAKQLVEQQVMRSVPSTNTIGQQLYRRLFSTPLKLGITTMTTASLITLGLLAISSGPSDKATKDIPKQSSQSVASVKKSFDQTSALPVVTEQAKLLNQHATAAPISQPPAFVINGPNLLVRKSAPVDSLKPFELTVDQLAQLGITLSDTGDIIVFEKTGNGESLNRYCFPPKAGVRMAMSIPADQLQGVQALQHLPRLVTEVSGVKRMYSFQSDTNFTKLIDGTLDTFQVSAKEIIADQPNELPDSNRWVKVFDDSSTAHYSNGAKVNFNLSSTLKSLGIDTNQVIHAKVMVREDAFMNSDSQVVSNPPAGYFSEELNKNDSVVPPAMKAHLRALAATLRRQGAKISSREVLPPGPYSDSLAAIGHEIAKRNGPGMVTLRIDRRDDSTTTHLPSKGLLHSTMESFLRHLDDDPGHSAIPTGKYRDSLLMLTDEEEDLTNHGASMLKVENRGGSNKDVLTTLRMIRKANEEYSENKVSLDHLIPVRVKNNSAAHPNELIFWYEPIPELTNMLPKASYPYRPQPAQSLNLSVYPNPTSGASIVHYEIKDGKHASFAIHDLLGKKLLDLGSATNATGEMNIDLSSLEAGVYLLITTTDDGERDVQRIVLAK